MRITRLLIFCSLVTAIAYTLQSCTNIADETDRSGSRPVLLSNAYTKASCVFLTVDEKDNPVISWVETDSVERKHFYFANWDDSAKRFGEGISIPIAPNTSIHEEGMPKLAVKGNGTIVATYETSVPWEKSRFGLSDINYILSFDGGNTWTVPQSIQPNEPHTGSRSFGNLIRLDDGEVGAAWLDANPDDSGGGGRPVKFAKSNKEGFGEAILIEPFACQCCRTAISSDGLGNINIVFRDLLSGSVRDISVSRSTDNGRTFSAPSSFSDDNWVIDGCPHNGPSVAAKNNKTYVTWFTGTDRKGVYYAELDLNNRMQTKYQLDVNGRFTQLCLMSDGTRMIAYNKSYKVDDSIYSKIMVNRIDDNGIFELEVSQAKTHASFPVIQPVDGDYVVAAWSSEENVYYRTVKAKAVQVSANRRPNFPLDNKGRLHSMELSLNTDPVCRMPVDQESVGDTTLYQNKIIGFCSNGCKEIFLRDPVVLIQPR